MATMTLPIQLKPQLVVLTNLAMARLKMAGLSRVTSLLRGSRNQDDQLMQKIQQGNHDAFDQLYQNYGSLVLGYSCRLLADKNLAEDISQEVWVKVVKTASHYQAQGKFRSWLLTLTRNCCLSHLRRPRLEVLDSEGQVGDEAEERASLEADLIRKNDIEIIKVLIDQLPEAQRTCLVIWMSEEISYQELADQLQMNLSAVKSLLYRAKQNLISSFDSQKGEV